MAIARLKMTGDEIAVTLFLPVTPDGRFSPSEFSFPWPRAVGKWDGKEYFADIDWDEELGVVEFAWNDGEVTRGQLPPGLSLLAQHDLRLESNRINRGLQVRMGVGEIL